MTTELANLYQYASDHLEREKTVFAVTKRLLGITDPPGEPRWAGKRSGGRKHGHKKHRKR